MTNVKMTVDGDILTITVDLSETHGPSKSGKTMVIATTSGIVPVEGADNGAKIGLNIFKARD